MLRWPLVVLLTSACSDQRALFDEVLPSEGVDNVFCDIERGSFTYSGSSPESFQVQVASWGSGVTKGLAEARIQTNEWGVTVADDSLDLFARSPAAHAGVDLLVEGPPKMDVETVLLDGVVQLFDVTGTHTVTANGIVGAGLVGDLDLLATRDGMDLEARPEPGQTLILESHGDLKLALPYGAEYDLEVFADPDQGVEITDLGFDELFTAPDYARASTGSAAIRIEVTVYEGTFFLWNLEP